MFHFYVTAKELNDLLAVALEANNNGISFEGNASYTDPTGESNWSFSQALFFTVTILTTIGMFGTNDQQEMLFCKIYGYFFNLGTSVLQVMGV